jgi:putative FmdB family regulatory protein
MYEYKCKQCGFNFERLQKMSEEPIKICPKCSGKVKRLIGSDINIIFKGSGFYVNDYGKGSRNSSNIRGNNKIQKPANGFKKN